MLMGPTAVQILSWPHQGSNHRPCGSKSSSLTTTLQAAPTVCLVIFVFLSWHPTKNVKCPIHNLCTSVAIVYALLSVWDSYISGRMVPTSFLFLQCSHKPCMCLTGVEETQSYTRTGSTPQGHGFSNKGYETMKTAIHAD